MEGELRYREFVPKKQKKQKNDDHKIRVAEIHLWRIEKLDRAEKRDSDTPAPSWRPKPRSLPSRGSLWDTGLLTRRYCFYGGLSGCPQTDSR